MRTVKDPVVRKSEIIAAAMELFQQNGYEKTTVESIINKLGVAKGCFYHHYRSKEEVFEECVSNLTRSLMDAYAGILEDTSKPAKQRLMEYIDYNFAASARQSGLSEAIHSDGFEDLHAAVVKASAAEILPVFIRLIEQIYEESNHQDRNAEFSAVALLGAFREIHEHYSHSPKMDLDKLYPLTIDLMENILDTPFR